MKQLTCNIKGALMDFSLPKVMGILNITPDSFFEGSRKQTEKEIAGRVIQIMEEGADIIDIGGYSSRPSATYVDEAAEISRLEYGLKILFREIPNAIVSVDTFRSEVAKRCVEDFGVAIINDIAAGSLDPKMFETVARLQVPYIIMHLRGTPQTMMQHTNYENIMQEIFCYFAEKVNQLHQMGVNDIWIDPGFGFSKTTSQNYEILEKLEEFLIFELPVLVGFSRKTMIREVIETSPAESLNGTTALNMFALTKDIHILRVHDVKEAVQTVKLFNKIKNTNE
ncbi:MAG: dihydropteroate synthase [Dysgonamonadaceae bacterium]|jgi:dihydropteroate synthase|nr:dihydropteroate synthase [Dysgonamonadaceae bacterium]